MVAVAVCFAFAAMGRGSAVWLEAAGRCWPLLGVIAVPMLIGGDEGGASPLGKRRLQELEGLGLIAAGIAGLWALVEVGLQGRWPWLQGVDGPFSHHLTLGYALLIPLARALRSRAWGLAAVIGIGVGCAGASGPLLSALVLVVALTGRPLLALVGGAMLAVGIMLLLGVDPELYQRVVLWPAAASLPDDVRRGLWERSRSCWARIVMISAFWDSCVGCRVR